MDFSRAADPNFKGIVQMYRDLIALRCNVTGKSRGLTGQNLMSSTWITARRRWPTIDGRTGPGDDVVVVANSSNVPMQDLNIGFPRGSIQGCGIGLKKGTVFHVGSSSRFAPARPQR